MAVKTINAADYTDPVAEIVSALSDPQYTQIKLKGTFDFGDNVTGRRTIEIPRGVSLRGESVEDGKDPKTRIIGGGAYNDELKIDTGAFMVISDGPVVVKDIWFSGWKGEAIAIQACQDLDVSHCKFTDPVPGTLNIFDADGNELGFANAVFALYSNCRGSLSFKNNKGMFADGAPAVPKPDDEGFLACVQTNFNDIQVSDNEFTGRDEGFEIIRNGWDLQNEVIPILFKRNELNLTESLGNRWPGHAGFMCLNNHNARTEIGQAKDEEDGGNTVDLRGPGIAFALSGENFVVKGNEIKLRKLRESSTNLHEYPVGFQLGCNLQPWGFDDLCPSFSNSTIEENSIKNEALCAIWTPIAMRKINADGTESFLPNDSHSNQILDNDLSRFHPQNVSLDLAQGTHDNLCSGCFPGPDRFHDGVIDKGIGNQIENVCPPTPNG